MYSAKTQNPEPLRVSCGNVETSEEGLALVRLLEYFLKGQYHDFLCLTAPEINFMKRVAVIRTPSLELDLVNPQILEVKGNVLAFHEPCYSHPGEQLNCLRYDTIVLQNGLDGKRMTLSGVSAALVQHAVDHLDGVSFQERAIRAAVVRPGGEVLRSDYCPCGSKRKFSKCCMKI